jgi:hypothetical protein
MQFAIEVDYAWKGRQQPPATADFIKDAVAQSIRLE